MRFRDLQRYPLSEIVTHIAGGDRAITSDGDIVFWLIPRDSQAKPLEHQAQTQENTDKDSCLAPRDSHAYGFCPICKREHMLPLHGQPVEF